MSQSKEIDPSDLLLREVDEEVRRDQMVALWNKYSNHVIGGVLVLALVVAGVNFYRQTMLQKSADASVKFQTALDLVAANKGSDAALALGAFSGPQPYAAMAKLVEANQLAAGGDVEKAQALIASVANDPAAPSELRDMASIRAIGLKLDGMPLDQAKAALAPLMAPSAPFRHTARELLAAALLKANDLAGAEAELRALTLDPATPAGLKQRANDLLTTFKVESAAPAASTPNASVKP